MLAAANRFVRLANREKDAKTRAGTESYRVVVVVDRGVNGQGITTIIGCDKKYHVRDGRHGFSPSRDK